MAATPPVKFYNKIIKDQVNLDKFSLSLGKRVKRLLSEVEKEVVGVLAQYDPTEPNMTKWKKLRLEKIKKEIDQIVKKKYVEIDKMVSADLKTLAVTIGKETPIAYNVAFGANLMDVVLTPQNLSSIVDNTMINGNIIGEWWDKQSKAVMDKMMATVAASTQALQIGMAQGETIGELIGRIRGTALSPGVLSFTKREAEALVRTSVMQVSNVIRQETYKANADILSGFRIVATLDGRTTPLCRSLDGLEYDMDLNPIGHDRPYPGTGGPPFHFNCRSTIMPITKSWSELAGPNSSLDKDQLEQLDNLPPGVKETINGPIPIDMTYDEWLRTLPVEEQIDILGPGKWKLWNENDLSVRDLVDNYGNELTIKQLQKKLLDADTEKAMKILAEELGIVDEGKKTLAELAAKAEALQNLDDFFANKITFGELIGKQGDEVWTNVFAGLPEGEQVFWVEKWAKTAKGEAFWKSALFNSIEGVDDLYIGTLKPKAVGKLKELWAIEIPKKEIKVYDDLLASLRPDQQEKLIKIDYFFTGMSKETYGATDWFYDKFYINLSAAEQKILLNRWALVNPNKLMAIHQDYISQIYSSVLITKAKPGVWDGILEQLGVEVKASGKEAKDYLKAAAKDKMEGISPKKIYFGKKMDEALLAEVGEENFAILKQADDFFLGGDRYHFGFQSSNWDTIWKKLYAVQQNDLLMRWSKTKNPMALEMLNPQTGIMWNWFRANTPYAGFHKFYNKTIAAQQAVAAEAKVLKFENMVNYGPQQGSNKGGYYYVKGNPSEKYYIKTPVSEDIARNEMLASKLYASAGVEVPELFFIEVDGKVSIASRIVEGLQSNPALLQGKTFRAGIYDNFAVDAWLGNWDVAGLSYDNLLIKDGVRAFRVDVGGSLRYRAQGGLKGLSFGDDVLELKSMLDEALNPQSAAVFKSMKKAELEEGVRKVLQMTDDKIKALVDEWGPLDAIEKSKLTQTLINRRNYMQKQFPKIDVNKAAPVTKTPEGKLGEAEIRQVQNSRMNGYTIRIDKEDIEDIQVLFWTEKDKAGRTITGAQFKVRGEALRRLEESVERSAVMFDDFQYKMKDLVEDMREYYWRLENAPDEAAKYVSEMKKRGQRVLDILKKINADLDPVFGEEIKKVYKDQIEVLISFMRNPQHLVRSIDDRAFWDKVVAEVTAKPKGQFVKSDWEIYKKDLMKGWGTRTGEKLKDLRFLDLDYEKIYSKTYGNVKIDFFPRGYSLKSTRGMIRIYVTDEADKGVEKILKEMKNLGINTARAAKEDVELLYLHQIANHAKLNVLISEVDRIPETSAKIEAYKKALNKAFGVDITKSPDYNPFGSSMTYDTGRLVTKRPDLAMNPEWERFSKEHFLFHTVSHGGQSEIECFERVLNSGGNMASRLEQERRGFGVKYGWSPAADLRNGGSDYFYTRIRRRESTTRLSNYPGLYWKSDPLKRLDSFSFKDDLYGKVIPDARGNSVSSWERYARGGDNESLFKGGLSIFDKDFLHWRFTHAHEAEEARALLRRHGFDRWIDGRTLEQVFFH